MHLMSQNRAPSREECFEAQRALLELAETTGWALIRDFLETTCRMIDGELHTCPPEVVARLQERWQAYDMLCRLPTEEGILVDFYQRVLEDETGAEKGEV